MQSFIYLLNRYLLNTFGARNCFSTECLVVNKIAKVTLHIAYYLLLLVEEWHSENK